MEKLLTIIIPTYNMEEYLSRCLSSLIVGDALMASLEVLVVNDGSKDKSSIIAHEFSDNYPNTIFVIDKENGNYGSCINRGLKEAKGKYVKVLDSDDWLDTCDFKLFLADLQQIDSDMVLSNYSHCYPNKNVLMNICQNYSKGKIYGTEVLKEDCLLNMEMHAVCYKKDILVSNNYIQTEKISYTDQEWIYYPLQFVNTISFCPYNVYQYMLGRPGQTMDPKVMAKSLSHKSIILKRMIDKYAVDNNKCNDENKSYYLNFRLNLAFINTYKTALLKIDKNTYLNYKNVIEDVDSYVKNCSSAYYDSMNNFVVHKYLPLKFIRHWRKHLKRYNSITLFFINQIQNFHSKIA